jgi:sterol desaturase/sphingolipid hydroxylase (fatty acid hydroxylase superfamily)
MTAVDPIKLYLMMLPVFVGAIALEALYYRAALKRPYGWKVTVSNLTVAIGRLASDAVTKAVVAAVYVGAYQLRPFDIPLDRWEGWVALFFAVEFAYYWLHRFSHEIRWMWTQHSVHHSARQITLSVAYRLGWTQFFAGPWLFLVPVCWIGFDPRAVVLMYAINLLYQFWLHTEVVPKLGPLERVLNTPSHHRVHHAIEPEYLDRNYGGVLIVWDKLFGTFAPERDATPRTYGLVHQIDTLNPVKIAFAEWAALFRDLRAARGWREALGLLFGPPGWKADGSGRTTRAIRRAARIPENSRSRGARPGPALAAQRDARS